MTAEIKKSFCHLCLAECGINVTVENNQIIKILPNFDDPVSQGYICEKAQRLIGFQTSSDRITTPLKKVNNEFIPIPWEQAIDEISLQIASSKNKLYMAPLSPTYNANTLYSYELMKRLNFNYMCNVLSVEVIYRVLANALTGIGGTFPDRHNAQTLIMFGMNPWVTQHFPKARKILNDIKNDPNRQLIVIDPCQSETTKLATHHLHISPGSDSWLLRAIIKLIIDNDKVDHEFIKSNTINFGEVTQYFSTVDLNECLANCKLSFNEVNKIVNIIIQSKSVAIDSGNGLCHSIDSEIAHYLIILLYALTGNCLKKGTMVRYYSSLNKPHYLTNEQSIIGNTQFPGITPATDIAPGQFDCFVIDNNNPASRYPNSAHFIDSLKSANTVVVLDSFMSTTAKLADYILPTPTFLERYECVNSAHPENEILQLSEPVIHTNYKTANEIYELIIAKNTSVIEPLVQQYDEDRIKFYDTLYARYEDKVPDVYQILRETLGKQYKNIILVIAWWEFFIRVKRIKTTAESILHASMMTDELATIGMTKLGVANTNKLLINLSPDRYLTKLLCPSSSNLDFKYILQCGYRQKTSMNEVIKNTHEPQVEIYISDASMLNITDNEQVMLETSLTSMPLTCKLVNNSQPGLLRIANHPIINQLTDAVNIDYLNPQYKFVFANIRKINGNM